MQYNVKLLDEEAKVIQGEFILLKDSHTSLRLVIGNKLIHEATGDDYFHCLVNMREYCDSIGFKILCNGARYDVYPSRMGRQMSEGKLAYKMHLGKQASEDDLVDIFLETDSEFIGTKEEQEKFYKKWIKSLS